MSSFAWIVIWVLVVGTVALLCLRDLGRRRRRSSAESVDQNRRNAGRRDLVDKGTVLRKGQNEPGSAPGVFGPG
jgi:flagellar biosynthesis/type III secretory pathway M-ring protein FliF/YscJ